jgi:hypothetical protein
MKPKRKLSKAEVKAAADRAEARSKGTLIAKEETGPLNPPETSRKIGAPSKYTDAIAHEICEHLANGHSLSAYCMQPGKPNQSTVMRWLREHDAFRENYARARDDQAEVHADAITFIADTEEDPNKARIRIDARKWAAGKMKPKKYGDKITNEHVGKDDTPLFDPDKEKHELARWIALMLTTGGKDATKGTD